MRLLTILSLLLLSFSLLGQWVSHDSVGATVNTISKISFPSANIGYAIGTESGTSKETIYKTNDGGDSWINLGYPTTTNYFSIPSIHFVDSQTGFLSVNELGNTQVYKTTNGGQNWTNISPTTAYGDYSSVHFSSVDTGFLSVKDKVFRTINSGQSWSVDTLSGMDDGHIDFWNGQYGVVGGSDRYFFLNRGLLLYTNDGGLTWDEVIIAQFSSQIVDVQRVSSTHIFALGGHAWGISYLFRSIDAGASWDTLNLSQYAVDSQDDFNTLFFQDENIGYIGTEKGNILKTIDAGQTWAIDYSFSGIYPSVSDIDF